MPLQDIMTPSLPNLNVDFEQLPVSWRRRLETLGAIYHFWSIFLAPFLICAFFTYLFLYGYVAVLVVYFLWMWWDWDSPYNGGYPSLYFRNLRIHKWFCSYFPLKIHATADLPNDKNYLIGFHPHGIISVSAYNFMANGTGLMDLYPNITFHPCTLVANFYPPIRREWLMLHGFMNCSKRALLNVLGGTQKGHACVLVVGGADEALEAHPGKHVLTLKKRKGFIKLALETGAHLVPCFGFGENDLYIQAANQRGSRIRLFQEKVKEVVGVSPAIFHGRGILSDNSYGLLPFRKELNTVLGAPIPVEKCENPTDEQINELHELYIEKLTELFEEHKGKYGVEEDNHLIIR